MRKFLGLAVSGLLCALTFATVSMAQSQTGGWDFSVEAVGILAKERGPTNDYRAYVAIFNNSTNMTYRGYGTVVVWLWLYNPDGGEGVFRDSKEVEIKNGAREKIKFTFNNSVQYAHLDYRVRLVSPNGDEFFDSGKEEGRVEWNVDWEEYEAHDDWY